jgi:hypothetical protein
LIFTVAFLHAANVTIILCLIDSRLRGRYIKLEYEVIDETTMLWGYSYLIWRGNMKLKMTIIILIMWPLSLKAADELVLKLNLQPQSSYLYTMDMSQTRVQTVDGDKQSLSQEMLEVWKYNVISREKSKNIDLELTYKRIKVTQNFNEQSTSFDSDSPPEYLDPSMKGLASMPGAVLTVRMTTDGKVARIDGVDDMVDKMIKAMVLPNPDQKKAVIADLRKQWGTDAMKQSLEQITSFYPTEPVPIGESWNAKFDITSGGLPMHINSEYTLKSRNDGIATIDVASMISSDSTTGTVTMGSLKMAYNIKGSQNGRIEVDETTGLPLNSKLDMHYDGSVTVSGVPDQQPQTWPISADGSVLVTFVRQ